MHRSRHAQADTPGLKVVRYYCCYILRPTVILAGVEDRKGTTVVVVGDGLSVLSDLPTMLLAGLDTRTRMKSTCVPVGAPGSIASPCFVCFLELQQPPVITMRDLADAVCTERTAMARARAMDARHRAIQTTVHNASVIQRLLDKVEHWEQTTDLWGGSPGRCVLRNSDLRRSVTRYSAFGLSGRFVGGGCGGRVIPSRDPHSELMHPWVPWW